LISSPPQFHQVKGFFQQIKRRADVLPNQLLDIFEPFQPSESVNTPIIGTNCGYCREVFLGFAENIGMEENFDFEFRVRLPSTLAEKIAETARKERRSRNMQYVYMLENWFEIAGGLEARVANPNSPANEKNNSLPDKAEM
jgi:hypothetical protein